MDEFTLIASLAIALLAALLGGLIARALRQSLVLGYLTAGVLIGPHALRLVEELETIRVLATIGVVVLLFTIGLRFSLQEMRRVGSVAIGGGVLQIVLTAVCGIGISFLFNWSLLEKVTFGFLASFSSTMVVLAMLQDRGELDTLQGRVMFGILLVQDLAATFMMFLLPTMNIPGGNTPSTLALAILEAMVFLALVFLLGRWIIPRFIGRVAIRGSRELFIIAGAALCFVGAFAAYFFGLSAALGAFVIGFLISQSDFAHQVLGDITPIRDIFSALFFVSLGMLLNVPILWQNLALVLLVVALVFLVKFLIAAGTVWIFGYRGKTVPLVGAGMISIGEFSFVLAELGLNVGVLSWEFYSLFLAVAMLSLFIGPPLYSLTHKIYRNVRVGKEFAFNDLDPSCARVAEISEHVVICGHGRVGSKVAEMLDQFKIPYLVIDLDPRVIAELGHRGIPAIYGDASSLETLQKAGISCASLLLLAIPDPLAARQALDRAKKINPQIEIIARVHSDFEAEFLRGRGAHALVQPELEAGIEMTRLTLCRLGFPQEEIWRFINSFKASCHN